MTLDELTQNIQKFHPELKEQFNAISDEIIKMRHLCLDLWGRNEIPSSDINIVRDCVVTKAKIHLT